MKDSDKKILLALLAVAILGLTFFYVVKPTYDKTKALKSEIAGLQARLDELNEKAAHKAEILAETEEYNAVFDEELTKYPAEIAQEYTVMFTRGVEDQFDFVHKSLGLGRPELFYVLGQGEASGDVQVVEGEETEDYNCFKAPYTVSFQGSYTDLKAYLDYIADYKYRMNVDTINMSYDTELDCLTGNLTVNFYGITGPDRTNDAVDVDRPVGLDNIFIGSETLNGAVGAGKYDADNGAAIAGKHNVVMLLNNAATDAAAGIIVAADEAKEDTYVTSTDNERVAVKVSVYTAEDKNYISYEIGGKSYQQEVLSDDVTIYVKSSARVDSDDTNGVDVTISNTTNLGVYVKVVDDDATAPRFKVVSKTGAVKVY